MRGKKKTRKKVNLAKHELGSHFRNVSKPIFYRAKAMKAEFSIKVTLYFQSLPHDEVM